MVRELKLSPAGGVDCYPLSPMQQGMLFHRLGGGDPGVDVEQVICELHEEINAARFEQAWREVVSRHPVLRTGFEATADSEPRQVVYPASRVRLALHHEEFGSESEARSGLEEYLQADRRQGFSELTAPLVRVALLRGGPAHFWFVTTYHHLLLDARSMTLLFREVLDLHDAGVQGRALTLPKPRAYRDYIDWLQSHDLHRAESFWREQLQGFTAPTALPIARPVNADAGNTSGVDELAFRLSESTTRSLRTVAKKHDVTLNTLVQAAWSVVLSRYSGDEDVVFGAVRAGRKIPIEHADAIVGLLINTVPVRARLAAAAPIGTWLRQLREQWVRMRDFEHTPLRKIQQWSDVAPGRPLFDSIVSYQEPAWDAALNSLGGAWAQRSFEIRAQPNVPVALEVLAGAVITVKLIYNPVRFAGRAMARLMGHLGVVFKALAAETADIVGALPLLTPEELRQLQSWNQTAAEYPRDVCVQSLVERQAECRPEAVAVADPLGALNYHDLNGRANQLAHRLRKLGVTRESPVAVCMERSSAMIVGWLGTLKAGAAFVPIDPAYPKERIAFQIQDCGARVLLSQPATRSSLPPLSAQVAVIELAPGGDDFADEADTNLSAVSMPGDLAYVIYTSGSTGQPKGVAVEHRALMNLVSWHQRAYSVSPVDRATHLASPAFDASVWEIWPYLAAGASVHIPRDEVRVSPESLWRWMGETRISIAFMPTPLAEAAMNETWPEALALRALLTGGDKLKRPPPRDFPCPLVNHYGPTENTVVTTAGLIAPDGSESAPSIGKPIANTRTYVLDRSRRMVPVGVPGELYIGGESLARGYLNRPELTAEKFIPDPIERRTGARLYRSGDLVRWTEQGEIEFLGRLDGQVKIRGCRIELGEIEATLQRLPGVLECIVQIRPDARGEQQLIGYMRSKSNVARPDTSEVIEFLRGELPAFMVPAAIMWVDAWPLTPNGKIDRNGLPTAVLNRGDGGANIVSPRTPVEQTVARVWGDVLGGTSISRNDNFFDLGGHSLLAAQVVSRLNATWRAGISVRALFDHPTLAAFAAYAEPRVGSDNASVRPMPRLKRRTPRADLELATPN